MRNCQIPTVPRQPLTYRLEEITGTLWNIYWNDSLLNIELSRWKGSVTYGLGADISLPQCLATGIWSLAPKATSGPKSRGTSFGTTLWRHVQRYCAQFPCFMQIMCFGCSFSHGRTNLFNSFDKLKGCQSSLRFFPRTIRMWLLSRS